MALLTAVSSALTGADGTLVAAAASDTFANSGSELLLVENTSGSPVDVTVTAQATIDGDLDTDDLTVTVPDGKLYIIGPFAKGAFNDTDGIVHVAYSDNTDVAVGVISP